MAMVVGQDRPKTRNPGHCDRIKVQQGSGLDRSSIFHGTVKATHLSFIPSPCLFSVARARTVFRRRNEMLFAGCPCRLSLLIFRQTTFSLAR